MMNASNLRLETKRLILRTMLESDIDALQLIFTDPNVMAAFNHDPFTREQMASWLQRNPVLEVRFEKCLRSSTPS
jgi:RimJ/RimL family protein N-acetyltransferase